jgi:predicted AAA+ superfamily ATPase
LEVDLVLERDDGLIVGIEVKAGATVTSEDFSGMKALSQACQEKFALGVVLYDADEIITFGNKLAAVPISCLWS